MTAPDRIWLGHWPDEEWGDDWRYVISTRKATAADFDDEAVDEPQAVEYIRADRYVEIMGEKDDQTFQEMKQRIEELESLQRENERYLSLLRIAESFLCDPRAGAISNHVASEIRKCWECRDE